MAYNEGAALGGRLRFFVCEAFWDMKLENDLGRDPIGRLVWRIALPSMLAQFVSVLYSIVHRI